MPKISKTIRNGVVYDFHDASIGPIASDHLEEKAPVGELYTLNDDVFLQQTPALDDSTIEQAVGNTADNTQIHIQRVSSGTASNKLKLKIKKVGNPGDLTVQVMKGISVVVTADVEAYWYGDSSNTIATGTLSASNVTTSFQELEVTLNANFGGTKEELLNVVLSQASVDASNYYVIACDSTQWSEGFSFVAVNGNTRTRSKVMPYCTSAGFAQGLLCKVGSDYTLVGVKALLKEFGATQVYATSSWSDVIRTVVAGESMYCEFQPSTGSNRDVYFQVGTYNGNTYSNRQQYTNVSGNQTCTFSKSNTDDVALRIYAYTSGYYRGVDYFRIYLNDPTLKKTGENVHLRTFNGGLGFINSFTTFGRHIDGTWITHE